MKKEVLLIFKTHLDIGFTDYAKNVKENYINKFIPNAIKVGYELKDTDTPFVWTTGSWLIWEALKNDADGKVAKAIEDGIICWHGLTCTTHTEVMNTNLFEYGLSVSKELDKRFGRKTIAAKMTDVPGHTKGMIPMLKSAGIEFLHIGVNPATPLPPVPPLFKWRCGDDEITVMYQQGYGDVMEVEDFVIYFAHTNDNRGPQSGDEIIKIYNTVKEKYPDYEVRAATLSDVAERLRNVKDLPVLDKEIGDTWIHGVGTDPKKVGMFRELLRYMEENNIKSVKDADLTDSLMLVPEHTWGMNLQVHFGEPYIWYNKDFEKTEGTEKRKRFEASWQEQRDYLTKAADALDYTFKYEVKEPELSGYDKTDVKDLDFELSWQLFDADDYTRFMHEYLVLKSQNMEWLIWDYLKISLPVYKGGIYVPKCTECYEKEGSVLYKLEFEKDLAEEYGLPYFWAEETDGELNISMFGKSASRLPQAFWLKFKNLGENWEMSKLGQWIKPEDVVGSPLICATDRGIRNADTEIYPLDSTLLAPFGRNLLRYGIETKEQDMYFNLYNNIWNTNFPMWYSDDSLFRFKINKR